MPRKQLKRPRRRQRKARAAANAQTAAAAAAKAALSPREPCGRRVGRRRCHCRTEQEVTSWTPAELKSQSEAGGCHSAACAAVGANLSTFAWRVLAGGAIGVRGRVAICSRVLSARRRQ